MSMHFDISFSVFGCCVSYDLLSEFKKKSVCGFSSWVSIASDSVLAEKVEPEYFSAVHLSNYRKRNLLLDINKDIFSYLNKDKGEYLLFDPLDCRFHVLQINKNELEKDSDCYISLHEGNEYDDSREYILGLLNDKIDCAHEMAASQLDLQVYIDAANYVCDCVLNIFPPEKCIFNKLSFADCYIDNNSHIRKFNRKYCFDKEKEIIDIISKIVENRLDGRGHIIPELDLYLGDENNKYGNPYPLRYHDLVYEYGKKAIEIILGRYSNETMILDFLAKLYSEKINSLKQNLIMNEKLETISKRIRFLSDFENDADSKRLLLNAYNIDEYLDRLFACCKEVTIIIAIKDTPGLLVRDEVLERFHQLGFYGLSKMHLIMYGGIICKERNIYIEKRGLKQNDVIDIDEYILDTHYSILSKSYLNGNEASIKIDSVEYALNKRGINIVIYDHNNNKVIDSVVYDAHDNCDRFLRDVQ